MDIVVIYILAYMFCFIVGLLLWYFVWFRPGYCLVPEENRSSSDFKRAESFKAQTLREFLSKYGSLFYKLDANYWIENIGLDGYTYLYLQRQIIWILICSGVSYLGIRSLYVMFYPQLVSYNLLNTTVKLVDSIKNDNERQVVYFQEQAFLLSIFTVIIITFLMKTITHFRGCFLDTFRKTNSLSFKFLQLRTLHIQGMVLDDIKGEVMMKEIKDHLQQVGGQMVALSIVPNYSELVKLEIIRKDLLTMSRLIQSSENYLNKFWIPKEYRDKEALEKEISLIDDKIQKETENRFLQSGHAFVCFDSIKTMENIYNYLSLDTKTTVQLSVQGGIDLSSKFLQKQRMGRNSTFMKFEDEISNISQKYKDVKLLVRTSPEPADIIWENLGGQINLLRKILATVASLVVLIFLTTPNEIFEYFNGTILDLENYTWAYKINPILGEILKKNGPALITLGINQVLLLLIDLSAFYEKHTLHSSIQVSIFHKSVFYLCFNMLIIPSFSNDMRSIFSENFKSLVSLFEIVKRIINDPDILLTNFFGLDSALFYVAILFQSSLFSPMYYLLRITEFFEAYGSPWIAHYKRQFVQDEEKWRKQDSLFFQYGYFSAQTVTMFFIINVFGPSVPMMIPVGLLFFFNKHIVEGINLLVLHKAEIDSFGTMIQTKIRALLLCVISTTFFFMAYWYKNSAYVSMAVALFNLILLVITFYQYGKPFFYLIELDSISMIGARGAVGEMGVSVSNRERRLSFIPDITSQIDIWKKSYRHPLILKDEEFVLPFKNPSPLRASNRRQTIKHIELENSDSFVANY